jgi:cysteine desulfurase
VTAPSERVYADHAATTPVRAEVIAAMLPYLGTYGFNPSSLHAEGRVARGAVDAARAAVAGLLGAKPRDIVFTGGGSEANTLAIVGAGRAARRRGVHVVTSAVEHHAVLHATDLLRDEGFEVTVIGVDAAGRVDPVAFEAALRPDTVLASVMLANNELGTVQPIESLARIARSRGVVFHSDAVQAPGRIPLDVEALGVDLLTLSAHKFYGPKGVGALYVRPGTPLVPLIVGGGQERGLRAGTENVAGIVGFAHAFGLASAELPAEAERLRELRDRFETALERLPGLRINAREAERLPNVSSIAFADIDAPTFLVRLDLEGIAASAGSACAAGSTEPSHVLAACDIPTWAKTGTIRFSFGKLTGERDVERIARVLPDIVTSVRGGDANVGRDYSGRRSDRVEERS